jgi:flavin-dependent thymidylate synthase
MAKFERVEDKWRELRKDLYGNVEPSVELRAITMPLYKVRDLHGNEISYDEMGLKYARTCYDSETYGMDWQAIEKLPAISAGVSYGATEKLENDPERAIKLNKKLIEDHHDTPLEAIQMNFRIEGLSKTAGAQLSRYRTGNGHVSASRRFKAADGSFVYPMYDYLDEAAAFVELDADAWNNKQQYGYYLGKRERGIKKEDSRQGLPVSYSTSREWWVNVRALRYILKQRLKADTEAELRRLCWMIYDMVCPLMPSLFEDIVDAVTCNNCGRTLKIKNLTSVPPREQRMLIKDFICSDCKAPC